MQAIAHSLRICGCIGLKPIANDGLLGLRDQTLHPKVANGLITITTTENEIDGGEHLPLRHLCHHKADRWCFRLRRPWRTTFALVPFWSTPNLAIGMDSSPLFIQKWMETLGTTKTELQGNRTIITEHQTRRTVHLLDPIGELPRIGDGGG